MNWFIPHRTPSSQNGFAEGGAMDEPAKRLPEWLTIDLLIIALTLTVILIWIWIDF